MPAQRRVAGRRTALYRLFDAAGKLLYIGIAVNPPSRWTGHAADKLWWDEVARITIEWYATWELAERAEADAIARERPFHNVAGTPRSEFSERVTRAAHFRKGRSVPLRNIRIDRDVWDRFGEACAKGGANRTSILTLFIRWYVGDEDVAMPQRPTPTPSRRADVAVH